MFRALIASATFCKTKLVNVNGDTALTLAATHGRLDCVNALIEKLEEANEVLHETKNGYTALTLAIENGHEKVVSSLCLDGKARIEYESNWEDCVDRGGVCGSPRNDSITRDHFPRSKRNKAMRMKLLSIA